MKERKQTTRVGSRNLTSPDSDAPAWSGPGGNAGGYLHLNGIVQTAGGPGTYTLVYYYVLWCTAKASLTAFLKTVWASGVPTACQCNSSAKWYGQHGCWVFQTLCFALAYMCPRLHLHRWSEGSVLYMVQTAHLGRNRAICQRNPILLATRLLTRSMCWL